MMAHDKKAILKKSEPECSGKKAFGWFEQELSKGRTILSLEKNTESRSRYSTIYNIRFGRHS